MKQPFIAILTLDASVTAPTAATLALAGAGAGNVDNGAHRVKVTFVTDVGETEAGTASSPLTVVDKATDGKIAISAIPVSTSPLVTGRNVYMTAAGGSSYFLLSNGVIADNTSTTLTANDSDATLAASTAAPSTNTTTKANSLDDLLTDADFPDTQLRIFSQLVLTPTGAGSCVISIDPDTAAESEGFPLGDSFNMYAEGKSDFVTSKGQYLFSETPGKTVAVYARNLHQA